MCTQFSIPLCSHAHLGRYSFTTHLDIRTSGPPARVIPISQVEVATDIVSGLRATPSMEDNDSHISTDEQTHDKPNESSLVRDLERGI